MTAPDYADKIAEGIAGQFYANGSEERSTVEQMIAQGVRQGYLLAAGISR